jgi:hypothetical protein
MNTTSNNTLAKSKHPRRLALFALISVFTAPAVSTATTPAPTVSAPSTDEATPIEATDAGCDQSTIALQVHVSSGGVYLVNAAGAVLTDNEINIHVDTAAGVLVDIEYTYGDWDVAITPEGESTSVYPTRGGSLRYWVSGDYDEYEIVSTFSAQMSTMMNMTPVVPVIILRPKPDCPFPP